MATESTDILGTASASMNTDIGEVGMMFVGVKAGGKCMGSTLSGEVLRGMGIRHGSSIGSEPTDGAMCDKDESEEVLGSLLRRGLDTISQGRTM